MSSSKYRGFRPKAFALSLLFWFVPLFSHGATTVYIPSTTTYNPYIVNVATVAARFGVFTSSLTATNTSTVTFNGLFNMPATSTFSVVGSSIVVGGPSSFVQFNGSISVMGTVTNNNAAGGYVGEYISSQTAASTLFPTSGQFGDLVSITLTPGDWDVWGSLFLPTASGGIGGNPTYDGIGGISTTSGNSSTGLVQGVSRFDVFGSTMNAIGIVIPNQRKSISTGTTYFLKYFADYVGAPRTQGIIEARRAR